MTRAAYMFAAFAAFASSATVAHAESGPWSTASAGVEPRVGTYQALDPSLEAYGFVPVDSSVMLTWGLRARFSFGGGIYLPLDMTYAFSANQGGPDALIPTTSTLIESGGGVGYRTDIGLFAEAIAGFGVFSHTVGSLDDGGALVYMGPVIHPRVGYMWSLDSPQSVLLALSVGYALHLPIGSPHTNPLWEEPFERRATHALTIGFESGLQLRGAP